MTRLEQFRAVLDALPVPAALAVDATGLEVNINASFARIVGVAPEQYTPVTDERTEHPYVFLRDGRELHGADAPFARALAGELVRGERLDIRDVSGVVHHMVVSVTTIEEDGHVVGAIAVLEDIGEQVRAATLLREITALTPTLIFTTTATGAIDFVNSRWLDVIGVSTEALLGSGWTAFVHPADIGGILEQLPKHLVTGDRYVAQWRLRRADGTYRWMEIRAEPERNADGTILRWFGAGIDIDAQRRAMDALEFLAQGGVSVASEQDVDAMLGRLANAALEDLADITFFDLVGENGEYRRHVVAAPYIAPQALEAISSYRAPENDEAHPISHAMQRLRGVLVPVVDEVYLGDHVRDEVRRVAWRSVPVRSLISAPLSVGGRSYGAITMLRTRDAVPFDSADLRVVEEIGRRTGLALDNIRLQEIARAEAAERERQLTSIADSIPQLMWTARADGAIDWYNRRWYEYTGQTVEEAFGWGWKSVHHPDDIDTVLERWQHALRTGEDLDMEFRLRRRDGVFRWFLTRAVPLRDASGRVVKWYGTNTDVDDARRSARDLRVFAAVGDRVSGSLSMSETLPTVLSTLVPDYADWGMVTFADERGDSKIAATHHPDARRARMLATLVGKIYAESTLTAGSVEAVRRLEPRLYAPARYEHAARFIRNDVLDVVWDVGYHSVLVIPFNPEAALRGSIVLCMAEPGRMFDPLDLPFFKEFGRRVATPIANAQLYERERLVARSFQNAALPARLPNAAGFRFDAVYEAGRAEALVGGDWYDAFRLVDGRIVVSIGDVAGSGLQSAVTMASVRQAIRGVAHVHADPELMLEAADRALRAEAHDRFVTAFVGVIDPLGLTMTYRGAGHPAPLLRLPDGTLVPLGRGGLPLGLRGRDDTDVPVLSLDPGSLLVLYTDGLIESTHDLVEGERRLREALVGAGVAASPRPAKALHDAVLVEGSRDDVAILTIAIDAPPARPTWRIDARDADQARAARDDLIADLRRNGIAEEAIAVAELVFSELLGNLVRHAPGTAEVTVQWDEGRPVLHVRDCGPGFAFVPKLPQDVFSENGRGLYLIAALAEDFHVARRAGTGSHARVALRV